MYLDKQFNEGGSVVATDRVSKKYLMPTSIHQIQEQSDEHNTDEERKSFEHGYSEESENEKAPRRKFTPLTPSSGTTDNIKQLGGAWNQHKMKLDEQQDLFDLINKNRQTKLYKQQST